MSSKKTNGIKTPKDCTDHEFEIRVFKDGKKNVCRLCGLTQDIQAKNKEKKDIKTEKKTEIKTEKMTLLKAIQAIAPDKATFTAKDIIEKIRAKYPDLQFQDISVSLHLHALDAGNEKAATSNPSLAKHAFLKKIEKGVYKRAP